MRTSHSGKPPPPHTLPLSHPRNSLMPHTTAGNRQPWAWPRSPIEHWAQRGVVDGSRILTHDSFFERHGSAADQSREHVEQQWAATHDMGHVCAWRWALGVRRVLIGLTDTLTLAWPALTLKRYETSNDLITDGRAEETKGAAETGTRCRSVVVADALWHSCPPPQSCAPVSQCGPPMPGGVEL